MIRKSMDGRSWVVIPGGKAACFSCPAGNSSKDIPLACLDTASGGSGWVDRSFSVLCNFGGGNYGRVLVDSPEARAELFAAKASKS